MEQLGGRLERAKELGALRVGAGGGAEEEGRVKQLTAILAIAILPLPYLGITGAQKAISDAAMLAGDDEGAVRGALRGRDPRSANFQQKRRR